MFYATIYRTRGRKFKIPRAWINRSDAEQEAAAIMSMTIDSVCAQIYEDQNPVPVARVNATTITTTEDRQ